MTRLLARGDLARLLDVGQVIEAVQAAFAAYSAGQTVTPLRVGVEPPGTDGVLLAMPCAVADPPALGSKVVSVFRGNSARGLPTVASIYLLSDYETGAPQAVMDGTYLTALRTAAGSAVATRHLARPDARTLGVFGTGVQARFHIDTIRQVRPINRVLVCGSSMARAERFATQLRDETGIAAEPASPRRTAGADVLAVCTTSPTPVLEGSWVRQGAHINAVGAFTPTTRELPTDLVTRACLFVDTRAGALAEAGDLLIPAQEGTTSLEAMTGEIGEVVLGRIPGRESSDQVTVYKSVGAAFLDAATARLAYECACRKSIGQSFDFLA